MYVHLSCTCSSSVSSFVCAGGFTLKVSQPHRLSIRGGSSALRIPCYISRAWLLCVGASVWVIVLEGGRKRGNVGQSDSGTVVWKKKRGDTPRLPANKTTKTIQKIYYIRVREEKTHRFCQSVLLLQHVICSTRLKIVPMASCRRYIKISSTHNAKRYLLRLHEPPRA